MDHRRMQRKADLKTQLRACRQKWRHGAIESCPYCDYCNRELKYADSTVDHILAVAQIGHSRVHSRSNYALSCQQCNSFKSSHFLSELGLRLLRRRNRKGAVKGESEDLKHLEKNLKTLGRSEPRNENSDHRQSVAG